MNQIIDKIEIYGGNDNELKHEINNNSIISLKDIKQEINYISSEDEHINELIDNKIINKVDKNEILNVIEERKQHLKQLLGSLYNNKYITNNINKLEEWSKLKFNQIVYDSDIDGKSNEIFRNKIINHSHLYFIVIDDKNNVFGYYFPGKIDNIGNDIYDPNIFMFSLNSNGRCDVMKFNNKESIQLPSIYNDSSY